MNKGRFTKRLAALAVLWLSLCMPGWSEVSSLAGLPAVKMTLAHADVPDYTKFPHAAAVTFKEYVEKASEGKITVNISPGGSLGNVVALQEMTMSGEIEASTSHTEGTIAVVYPNIQVISIPYLFDSVDQALEVFRGEYGKEMCEDMRLKTGLRTIGICDNGGFRNFANNVRPIHAPNDMKGIKFRTMDNPAHIKLVEALGGVAIPISWAETYTAVQTRVVDGLEAPVPVILLGSMQDVLKYYTTDGHVYTQMFIFVNDKWFQKLPKAYQDIISFGGQLAAFAGERATRVDRQIGEDILSKSMQIYHPTLAEIKLFRDRCQQPVLQYIRGKVDNQKWVDKLLQAAQEANKKLGYTK
jgi:tripartite ATP-independent transporter DctP family solute receptor